MGIILTIPDVFRETREQFVEQVTDRFRRSIRAIYRVNRKREMPEHVGSCTLLSIEGRLVFVTAAHVADHNEGDSLYIAGEKGSV